jgi:hypothetical protein
VKQFALLSLLLLVLTSNAWAQKKEKPKKNQEKAPKAQSMNGSYKHLSPGTNWAEWDGKKVWVEVEPSGMVMQHPMSNGFNPETGEREKVMYVDVHPKGRQIVLYYYASKIKPPAADKKKFKVYGTLTAVGAKKAKKADEPSTKNDYQGYYIRVDKFEQ